MKYNIFEFDQSKTLLLVKEVVDKKGKKSIIRIDVIDLLILHCISDFMNRKKIVKYTIDDKTYFSVQYKVIIEDLPILNIKQQALTDRLNKLVMFDLLEKKVVKNQSGTWTAFRIGETYDTLKYGGTSSQLPVQEYSTTSAKVVNYHPKYSSTNNSSTNNYIREDSATKVASHTQQNSEIEILEVEEITPIVETKSVAVFESTEKGLRPKKCSLEEREQDFYNSLIPYLGEYGSEMVRDFYNYWTEPNQAKSKMRWELEKTWSAKKRLATWSKNQSKFNNNGFKTKRQQYEDQQRELAAHIEAKGRRAAAGISDFDEEWANSVPM